MTETEGQRAARVARAVIEQEPVSLADLYWLFVEAWIEGAELAAVRVAQAIDTVETLS